MKRLSGKTISYLIIAVLLICAFVVYGMFCHNEFLARIPQALGDLWQSLQYYFQRVFLRIREPNVDVTVIVIPDNITDTMPMTFEDIGILIVKWWFKLWSFENFLFYVVDVLEFLEPFLHVLILLLSAGMLMGVILKRTAIPKDNVNRGNTKPLKAFIWLELKLYRPVKNYVVGLIQYLSNKVCRWFFILPFVVFYGVAVVIIEVVSYMFYLFSSFDFASIYSLVVKAFFDLLPLFSLPVLFWVIFGICFLLWYRKRKALKTLGKFEYFNRLYVEDLPIISFTTGLPGTRKTTKTSDVALTAVGYFKEIAYDKMTNYSVMFPNFDWRAYEDWCFANIESDEFFSLESIKNKVNDLSIEFEKTGLFPFNYDISNFPIFVYDGLKEVSIFYALTVYAQCLFIYTRDSILISNYAIRDKNRIEFIGNSVLCYSDYYNDVNVNNFSHVINFDSLRQGRRFHETVEKRKKTPVFDFGIVVVTEAGKEFGNMTQLKEQKMDAEECNQKNDLHENFYKTIRHTSTVDYFPFSLVLLDDQRPESLGADMRELSVVDRIESCSSKKLSMPFYWIEEILHEWIYPRYVDFRNEYMLCSGKQTLLFYLFKKIAGKIHCAYDETYNRYGYYKLNILRESGRLDGSVVEKEYYLSVKKVMSDVFATDCLGGYLNDPTVTVGIDSLPPYENVQPTVQEFSTQNSHFIRQLEKKNDRRKTTRKYGS